MIDCHIYFAWKLGREGVCGEGEFGGGVCVCVCVCVWGGGDEREMLQNGTWLQNGKWSQGGLKKRYNDTESFSFTIFFFFFPENLL